MLGEFRFLSTYSVKISFSLIPLIQEVRLRIRTTFPSQMWTGLSRLRNHGGEHGSRKPAKPRSHCGTAKGDEFSNILCVFFYVFLLPERQTTAQWRGPPSCAESTCQGCWRPGGSQRRHTSPERTAAEPAASGRRAPASTWTSSASRWTAHDTPQPLQTQTQNTQKNTIATYLKY